MELVNIVIKKKFEMFNLRLTVIGQFKYHLKAKASTSARPVTVKCFYVFCDMPARVTQRHYVRSLFILLFPLLSGHFLRLRLIKITSVSNPLRMRDGCIS